MQLVLGAVAGLRDFSPRTSLEASPENAGNPLGERVSACSCGEAPTGVEPVYQVLQTCA
jgi:hypothetical protein